MHRPLRIVVLLAALGAPAGLHGAVHDLTLEAAVRLAQRQSPAARRIVLEARRSDLAHRRGRREAWPDLALELQAPILAREFSIGLLPSARTDTVLRYGKITTTRSNAAGNLRLKQLLPWRGSISGLGSVYYRDEETERGLLQSRNDYQVDASLALDVPVLGDEPARRALRRAAVEHDRARLQERAARSQLEFDTATRYLALLRARLSLDIVRSAAQQAAHAHELARRKVAAGLLAEVDALRLEVSRAEQEARLAQAEGELARADDAFKIFLGLPQSDSLVLSETLAVFDPRVEVEAAVRDALDRRAEIGLAEADLELLEQDRRARRPYRPDVALALRYGGGSSEAVLDRALEALSANDLSFSVSLQVPLWDGGRSTLEEREERTAIALRQLDLEESRARIELEVRDAARELQDAERRHALFEASSRVAEESLRISAERYERGLIDTSTYLSAQADAAAARLGRTGALLDLYQARARLHLVTLAGGESP